MGAVSTGKDDLVRRFNTLQHTMCQTSEGCDAGCPEYIDVLVRSLSELGLGCVMSVFPPARRPSDVRGEDSYSVACWMDIVDMRSDLVIRMECRSIGDDRDALMEGIVRKTFETAGMVENRRFPETKYLDICRRLNLFERQRVTPEVPYVCV